MCYLINAFDVTAKTLTKTTDTFMTDVKKYVALHTTHDIPTQHRDATCNTFMACVLAGLVMKLLHECGVRVGSLLESKE